MTTCFLTTARVTAMRNALVKAGIPVSRDAHGYFVDRSMRGIKRRVWGALRIDGQKDRWLVRHDEGMFTTGGAP